MTDNPTLEALAWAGLGMSIGVILGAREIWFALLPAGLFALAAAFKMLVNTIEAVDAFRHRGRKMKPCRLVMQRWPDQMVCRQDTRDGGDYGHFCRTHREVIRDIEERRASGEELPIRWGDYTIARDGSVKFDNLTLYRAATEGELVEL